MCSDTKICLSTPFIPAFSILAWPPQSDQYINLWEDTQVRFNWSSNLGDWEIKPTWPACILSEGHQMVIAVVVKETWSLTEGYEKWLSDFKGLLICFGSYWIKYQLKYFVTMLQNDIKTAHLMANSCPSEVISQWLCGFTLDFLSTQVFLPTKLVMAKASIQYGTSETNVWLWLSA